MKEFEEKTLEDFKIVEKSIRAHTNYISKMDSQIVIFIILIQKYIQYLIDV